MTKVRVTFVMSVILVSALIFIILGPTPWRFLVIALGVLFLGLSKGISARIFTYMNAVKARKKRKVVALQKKTLMQKEPGRVQAAQRHYVRAEELLAKDQWQEAKSALDEAISEFPYHHQAHLLQGKILFDFEGRYDEAFEAFDRAIESEPSELEAHAVKVTYQLRERRYAEAISHIEKEIALRTIESGPYLVMDVSDVNQLLSATYTAKALVETVTEDVPSKDRLREIRLAEKAQDKVPDKERGMLVRERILALGFADAVLGAINAEPIMATLDDVDSGVDGNAERKTDEEQEKDKLARWREILQSEFRSEGVRPFSREVRSEYKARSAAYEATIHERDSYDTYDAGDGGGE